MPRRAGAEAGGCFTTRVAGSRKLLVLDGHDGVGSLYNLGDSITRAVVGPFLGWAGTTRPPTVT